MNAVATKRKPKAKSVVEPVLVLRTCDYDMRSHDGFTWPASGHVACPDWKPTAQCGNGLHGLLWGEGNGSLLDWSESAKWLVVEVDPAHIVDLGGKIKFPAGNVIYCGDRTSAAKRICDDPRATGKRVAGGTATAGYRGTATAGDRGTATAGDRGTATAGDRGTATAGYLGTATAGDRGTATAGYRGTATAGENGCLCIHWYEAKRGVYRVRATDVDGDKIKPGVAYKLNESGEFVEATA